MSSITILANFRNLQSQTGAANRNHGSGKFAGNGKHSLKFDVGGDDSSSNDSDQKSSGKIAATEHKMGSKPRNMSQLVHGDQNFFGTLLGQIEVKIEAHYPATPQHGKQDSDPTKKAGLNPDDLTAYSSSDKTGRTASLTDFSYQRKMQAQVQHPESVFELASESLTASVTQSSTSTAESQISPPPARKNDRKFNLANDVNADSHNFPGGRNILRTDLELQASRHEKAVGREPVSVSISDQLEISEKGRAPDGIGTMSAATDFIPLRSTSPSQQIAENIKNSISESQLLTPASATGTQLKTIHVKLDPEGLGEVEVAIRVKGTQLEIKIRTANETTAHLLDANKNELLNALVAADLQIATSDVQVGHISGLERLNPASTSVDQQYSFPQDFANNSHQSGDQNRQAATPELEGSRADNEETRQAKKSDPRQISRINSDGVYI